MNMKVIGKIFDKSERHCDVMAEMTKVVLLEGESLIRKILSGLIQEG